MNRPALLILRPEPGAQLTEKLARDHGWRPIVSPIFRVQPIAWDAPPATDYDALIVTSANSVRHGGKALKAYRDLPAYAVGNATARALKAAGFTDIRTGRGNVAVLLEAAAENGVRRALHLAGEDYRDADAGPIALDRRILYRSVAIPAITPGAHKALVEDTVVVLLHSGRAAEHFALLCDQARIDRRRIGLAALSDAIAASAGSGWGAVAIARKPDDAALLAAADGLCQ